jgi:hypothetical protein
MKAFDEPRNAPARQAGPILLFDGEVSPFSSEASCHHTLEDYDEHNRGRYPDFGLGPYSRLPGLVGQWPWEFVARYSGATVPDFHGVP